MTASTGETPTKRRFIDAGRAFSIVVMASAMVVTGLVISATGGVSGSATSLLIGGGVLGGVVIGSAYERHRTDGPAMNSESVKSPPGQFQTFFERAPIPGVGISIEDGEEPIVEHVNTNFEEVFGFDAETLEGESLASYIVPPEKRDESIALVGELEDGRIVEGEVQRETNMGFRTFAFTGIPVEGDDSEVDAYAIYSDVTTEQEQRQRLQVLYRVLRHDLRNRMNVVKGNAEIICEEITDPELREWAESLSASADELIELSSQTRQIERSLDAGDYARHTIDAAELVENVLEDVSTHYPEVESQCDTPDELHVIANGLIDTAVRNAIENAFEHNVGPEQSVEVSVRTASRNYAEISIRDDGPGIPTSERRLFDGGSEITQLQHASGLGLWLLNWIVTQSGGEIELTDRTPTGTEVLVRLPLAYREAEPAETADEIAGD
ncbi:PAS domain-containing sensor histidine kinase [Natranaeroarchaeum sulfidigenes]|uniref:histidine kinase n=1 Tax=Natranaeroarchaeum sulfidigenes TaxID=2784880 RepID=A0A897MR97_9EURY|nr:PAS domain-containing sensor histidine kinase [Natranaeroarchaeum sulfidigenes]QSG01499.1 Bacterio-opsin activator protein (contains PAS, GAF and HTH domains) [Natranaeroarchaeum sulfidigenes]